MEDSRQIEESHMSWQIACVANTVVITPECAQSLLECGNGVGEWDSVDDFYDAEDGSLDFNPDWNEWMDYLGDPAVLRVLAEYKVNGRVRFVDVEAHSDGMVWEYEFVDGDITRREWTIADWPMPASASVSLALTATDAISNGPADRSAVPSAEDEYLEHEGAKVVPPEVESQSAPADARFTPDPKVCTTCHGGDEECMDCDGTGLGRAEDDNL